MKKTAVACILAIALMISGSPAGAGELGDIGVGVKAGTLGLGAEATVGLLPMINGRASLNAFNYEYSGDFSDIDYDVDLKLFSAAFLVDWHPFGGNLRLSAGAVMNGNEVDLSGESTATYDIGDNTYSASQVGRLNGTMDFDDFAPYLGIGFGNAILPNKKLGISLDLGIVYQGTPDVTLAAEGPVANLAAFQNDIQKEIDKLEDDVEWFEYYPVISLGITYNF